MALITVHAYTLQLMSAYSPNATEPY